MFGQVFCTVPFYRQWIAIHVCTMYAQNLFKGVTYGFKYKMRLVYAHFPINANIEDDGKFIECKPWRNREIIKSFENAFKE